jgi:serine/threonine protein kinase
VAWHPEPCHPTLNSAIPPAQAKDKEEWPDILKELHILGSCQHKNVLSYLGAFSKDDQVRAVLGYCVGSCVNLFQRLKRPFYEKEIVAMTVQLLARCSHPAPWILPPSVDYGMSYGRLNHFLLLRC